MMVVMMMMMIMMIMKLGYFLIVIVNYRSFSFNEHQNL